MAHVGTTNGINQPAATGSGGQAGLWMALIAGAVIVAIALAFGTTQGTGSRPVIVAQRAPAVIVAPGAVAAPTFGPDWYARHMPAAVTAPTFGPDWYARHMPRGRDGSDLRSGLVRTAHAGGRDDGRSGRDGERERRSEPPPSSACSGAAPASVAPSTGCTRAEALLRPSFRFVGRSTRPWRWR